MAGFHSDAADGVTRLKGDEQKATGDFGAAHGRVLQLFETLASGMAGLKLIEGGGRLVNNEGEFIVEIFACCNGQATDMVKLAG